MRKKVMALVLALTVVSVGSVTVMAQSLSANYGMMGRFQSASVQNKDFYDEYGNAVYGSRMMYDKDGNALFGQGCYFYDEDGNLISAYGRGMYDSDGNPIARPFGSGGFGCH